MQSANHPSIQRSWTRLDGVDLLRGLAIFFVLMNHVNMRLVIAHVPYAQGFPRQLLASLVWNGQRGVQIFFAVSGFLITSTTLRRWGSPANVDVRRFYWLRFARIAPLLFLLLAILSGLDLLHVHHFVVSAKTGGLGRALFAALTFHSNILEARLGYLPGSWDILWSLSVEEMFYFFFPLACRLLGRGKLLIALLIGFVILGPFARTAFAHGNELWQEYSYLGGMDAIALGNLTALFLASRNFSRSAIRALTISGAALLIFILGFLHLAYLWGLDRTGLDMTILAVGTCMLIAVAAQTKWKAPGIFRPLLQAGQRSYEIYLTHMFVVFGLFSIFVDLNKPIKFVPALFIFVIVISALLGELVARLYSEPMNQWLRKRWTDRSSAESRFVMK